ncbi:MAG: VOC family protein [Acidimicrobiales bacterium]
MEYTEVTAAQFAELDGVGDWRYLLGAIHTELRAGSFARAADLITGIVAAADAADHHPNVDLRYPDRVRVILTTHATGGVTTHDVELARTISELARRARAGSDPLTAQVVEIALDTLDADRIRPFWEAVLAYRVDDGGNLVDPLGVGPPLWFQQMDRPRTERNRFHLDVTVPHDVAERRLAAALDAGGTLVSDARAKAFWVLADAEGNEVCICTWQDRG